MPRDSRFADFAREHQKVLQEHAERLVNDGQLEKVDLDGDRLYVHARKHCRGACPVHSPSDHNMRHMRLHWRSDRGIFERICEHGVGHPDPDTLAYLESQGRGEGEGVHGCDGCCRER